MKIYITLSKVVASAYKVSVSEAKRLIQQGAVKISLNGELVKETEDIPLVYVDADNICYPDDFVMCMGKKKQYRRIVNDLTLEHIIAMLE